MVQRYKILLILIAKNKLFCIFAPKKINYLSNKPFKFCSVMKVLRVLFMSLALLMVSGLSAQTVYNSNGSSCGKIESNGTVRNSSGSSIGKVDRDGVVRNGNGSQIGKIDTDGTVRNGNGSSIGKVYGVPKEWAAAYFFFFF
jgi:hypothetical protein